MFLFFCPVATGCSRKGFGQSLGFGELAIKKKGRRGAWLRAEEEGGREGAKKEKKNRNSM